jgi:capsular polysaccharide biosynthesis protein
MGSKKFNDFVTIDLEEVFYLLLHKLWIIIASIIVGAGAAYLVSMFFITPLYTSSTRVYLINRQDEERITFSDLQMGTQLTKDYSILVKGRYVLENVIDQLNLDTDYARLNKLVEVDSPQDTRILEIKVSYYDPEMARLLANAITRLSSDRMVEIMDMKEVNVLEDANYPTEPSSPKKLKNTIIGGLIGLGLSSLIIILKFIFSNNIRNANDIETYLDISVLGIIPLEKNRVSKRRLRARMVR